MLTVHHLGVSQSERIVWLCEELGIPYALQRYERRADNRLAPPDYKALHPIGAAPVIADGDLVLAESGAVVEYLIHTHGGGRLAVPPGRPGYADYLYWFHFANGTLQPAMVRAMLLRRAGVADDNPVRVAAEDRMALALRAVDARLQLSDWLAGPELTAADIMTVFSLSTMRNFLPFDVDAYPAIGRYLRRVGARPAYRRAMAKADPGLPPLA
ncbi:MAG: glutathione S-transferase family protein [Dongiaceae bacterium]